MSQPASTEKVNFQFKRPEFEGVSDVANAALGIGALASKLVQEERTRVEHPDGRTENVAEHSLSLVKVARELAVKLYPELDQNLVGSYASVHDDVEAYVGDTPTDFITDEGLEQKRQREKLGIAQLKKEYADLPSYVQLIEDYEAQEIPEARFVRIIDKIMPILTHFANEGKVMKENYSSETLLNLKRRNESVRKYLEEYPEFKEVVDLREELVALMAEKFLIHS